MTSQFFRMKKTGDQNIARELCLNPTIFRHIYPRNMILGKAGITQLLFKLQSWFAFQNNH